MNIKDYLNLAGEQGKVVIVSDDGKVQGVLLPYDEYKKIAGNKPQEPKLSAEDIAEKVNREILQAQLEEVISVADAALPEAVLPNPDLQEPQVYSSNAERIDSLINKRAQNLFKSMPYNYTGTPEVKVDIPEASVDEEISTNFDDI